MTGVIGPVRGFWRWLTSMRTALILLFLLAVAAVPGSLLPQRNLNIERVNEYLRVHPDAGPWLDRLWMFEVYSSPWFSAIYLLLFTSLVGCLGPRLRQHLRALRAVPPDAPARLDRLPHVAGGLDHDGGPAVVAEAIAGELRGRWWRTVVREHPDGTATVSAERGYLKETGNLVFHFALLAILIGVAFGALFGWHANRILVAGDDQAFCNSLQQYDDFGLGPRVTAADLPPFCVRLDEFKASYLDNGQPVQFTAQVSYTQALDDPWQRKRLEVNDPLRLTGANVNLLGHGYAPVIRYTDRFGVSQTTVATFLVDDGLLTSHGVAMFPDANLDPDRTGDGAAAGGGDDQVAFEGVYLPTAPRSTMVDRSIFPAERDPLLLLTAYQGNLGLDVGLPKSVYELDRRQIDTGRLRPVGELITLKIGQSATLPDKSTVEFVGTRQWIAVSVRHDPGELTVLGGAVALLAGLMFSLGGKRRRVWARVTPADGGRSLISLGALTRAEHAGFAAEFAGIVAAIRAHADRTGPGTEEK